MNSIEGMDIKKKIIFVCTGNTCRSPMAEAAMNHMLSLCGLGDAYAAESRGLYVFAGSPATDACALVCGNHGLDVTQHCARALDAQDLFDAHLILTMTKAHKQQICAMFEKNNQNVYTLSEFVDIIEKTHLSETVGVSDPYGLPLTYYESVFMQIETLISKIVMYLKNGRIS